MFISLVVCSVCVFCKICIELTNYFCDRGYGKSVIHDMILYINTMLPAVNSRKNVNVDTDVKEKDIDDNWKTSFKPNDWEIFLKKVIKKINTNKKYNNEELERIIKQVVQEEDVQIKVYNDNEIEKLLVVKCEDGSEKYVLESEQMEHALQRLETIQQQNTPLTYDDHSHKMNKSNNFEVNLPNLNPNNNNINNNNINNNNINNHNINNFQVNLPNLNPNNNNINNNNINNNNMNNNNINDLQVNLEYKSDVTISSNDEILIAESDYSSPTTDDSSYEIKMDDTDTAIASVRKTKTTNKKQRQQSPLMALIGRYTTYIRFIIEKVYTHLKANWSLWRRIPWYIFDLVGLHLQNTSAIHTFLKIGIIDTNHQRLYLSRFIQHCNNYYLSHHPISIETFNKAMKATRIYSDNNPRKCFQQACFVSFVYFVYFVLCKPNEQ